MNIDMITIQFISTVLAFVLFIWGYRVKSKKISRNMHIAAGIFLLIAFSFSLYYLFNRFL